MRLPVLAWLPSYDRRWLSRDVLAGLTVWALAVPESLAYAGIAGVPVQYGMYTIPLALVGYLVFGGCRQRFVAPARPWHRSRPWPSPRRPPRRRPPTG